MKIPGWLFLVVSQILFGLRASIYTLLKNEKPLIFNTCNVICASTTIALLFSVLFLRKDLTKKKISSIPSQIWMWMLLGTMLSSILGELFAYLGLDNGANVAAQSVLERSQSVFLIIAEPLLTCCT